MAEPVRSSRWWEHPLFPVGVFIVVSLTVRENYPFSHFSMYSRPSSKPLPFHYLADGEGRPLPVMKHTRMSCAALSKKMGTEKGRVEKERARGDGSGSSADEIKLEAGRRVLADLRERSMRERKKWHLPERIQLVEVLVTVRDGRAHETSRPVAWLP
jgi:hypothetical protein